MKAVVLHSGGLDSTTLISQAMADGCDEILALSVQYGSLHNLAEGFAADDVIKEFAASNPLTTFNREVVKLPPDIFRGQHSALMGEVVMPTMTYQQIRDSEGPSPTVVPFRNANLISIAAAIADARGFDFVYIGAHADDANDWAYPDCTPEFLGAMANAVFVGTYQKVRLVFPFIWMRKYEIVQRAAMYDSPIDLSWSCYNPQSPNDSDYVHCGTCPTCIERANAFAEAGYWDPTGYMIELEDILDPAAYDYNELEEWRTI